MVSGLVTSPLDHERICFEEARPMDIASKLLMSIKCASGFLLDVFLVLLGLRLVGLTAVALGLDLLLGLVRRIGLLGTHAREVDAELLGRAQKVVVLVADLHASALLGAH